MTHTVGIYWSLQVFVIHVRTCIVSGAHVCIHTLLVVRNTAVQFLYLCSSTRKSMVCDLKLLSVSSLCRCPAGALVPIYGSFTFKPCGAFQQ